MDWTGHIWKYKIKIWRKAMPSTQKNEFHRSSFPFFTSLSRAVTLLSLIFHTVCWWDASYKDFNCINKILYDHQTIINEWNGQPERDSSRNDDGLTREILSFRTQRFFAAFFPSLFIGRCDVLSNSNYRRGRCCNDLAIKKELHDDEMKDEKFSPLAISSLGIFETS